MQGDPANPRIFFSPSLDFAHRSFVEFLLDLAKEVLQKEKTNGRGNIFVIDDFMTNVD